MSLQACILSHCKDVTNRHDTDDIAGTSGALYPDPQPTGRLASARLPPPQCGVRGPLKARVFCVLTYLLHPRVYYTRECSAPPSHQVERSRAPGAGAHRARRGCADRPRACVHNAGAPPWSTPAHVPTLPAPHREASPPARRLPRPSPRAPRCAGTFRRRASRRQPWRPAICPLCK